VRFNRVGPAWCDMHHTVLSARNVAAPGSPCEPEPGAGAECRVWCRGHGPLLRLLSQPAGGSKARCPARARQALRGRSFTNTDRRASLFIRQTWPANLRARPAVAVKAARARGSGRTGLRTLSAQPPQGRLASRTYALSGQPSARRSLSESGIDPEPTPDDELSAGPACEGSPVPHESERCEHHCIRWRAGSSVQQGQWR
jgi:hypothetical protein